MKTFSSERVKINQRNMIHAAKYKNKLGETNKLQNIVIMDHG